MASATLSRWTRRYLVVAVVCLALAGVAIVLGAPRRTEVALGLYGFVLTTAFGKAYTLVPSYFDRTLVVPQIPAVHLPIQVVAVSALAVAPIRGAPSALDVVGPVAWGLGVAVFAGTVLATIATNPLGRETATSESKADRAALDRLANPFMPVALGYLLVGSYTLLAPAVGLPALIDGVVVRSTHLLAAGFALLLLFSVGYRLLPRFLVANLPTALAGPVLVAGAVAPALLAVGYPAGVVFQAGAALESLAVVGFAVSYGWLFFSTDRDRVGFYGPMAGVVLGLGGVLLGAWFAFVGIDGGLVRSHLRLNVFGLLGLSVLGVIYQFYPPAVSAWPGEGDRLALASIALVAAGVVTTVLTAFGPAPFVALGGGVLALGGVVATYLVVGTIWSRTH